MCDRYVTVEKLAEVGLTPADVRRLVPWAVEYTDLRGHPCWLHQDLAEVLGEGEEQQP